MHPGGDQSGDMSHVDHQLGSDFISDRPEGGEIQDAGVGARSGDDQLRPVLQCQSPHLVHVDASGLPRHPVVEEGVRPSREVDGKTMREMPPMGKVHGEDRIPGLQSSGIDRLIGRRTRMRLHVGMFGAKSRLGPLDRQPLDLVHHFAAAVVALARVSLGVLVGEHGPHGFEYRGRGEVLGGYQLDVPPLPGQLLLDQARYGGVHPGKGQVDI